MREYFKSKVISTKQASLVFKFRTRMVAVKENFKNNLTVYPCPCCRKEDDNQLHLISCEKLTNSVVTLNEYNALFGPCDEKMAQVIPKLESILEQRNAIIEENRK